MLIYKIKTYHETYIGLKDGAMFHSRDVNNHILLAKLHNSDYGILFSEKNIGYLKSQYSCFNEKNTPVNYFSLFKNTISLPFHLVKINNKHILSLNYRKYLSANKIKCSDKSANMLENKVIPLTWETFFYIPFEINNTECIDTIFQVCLTAIHSLIYDVKNALEHILSSDIDNLIKQLIVYLLFPLCNYDDIYKINCSKLNEISYLLGNSIYYKIDNTTTIKDISNVNDCISELPKNAHSCGLSVRLQHYIHSRIKPQKKSAVVATARNESVYLLQFCAWYQALGFDDIIIYSNNNTDNSDEILSTLANIGMITYLKNDISSCTSAQFKAYQHALLDRYIYNYKWILFVDIDEFLVLNSDLFADIKDFLNFHELYECDAIAINWIIVGSNNQAHYYDDPDMVRFKIDTNTTDKHIKSFVKPHKVFAINAHYAINEERESIIYRQPDRRIYGYTESMALAKNPLNSHAAILHFWSRSCEEFIWKIARHRGDKNFDLTDSYDFDIDPARIGLFLKKYRLPPQNSIYNKYIDNIMPAFNNFYVHLKREIPLMQQFINQFKNQKDEIVSAFIEQYNNTTRADIKAILLILEEEKQKNR